VIIVEKNEMEGMISEEDDYDELMELRLDYSAKPRPSPGLPKHLKTLDSFDCNQFFVITITNPKDGKFYPSYSS
jgi:hypothetical protein